MCAAHKSLARTCACSRAHGKYDYRRMSHDAGKALRHSLRCLWTMTHTRRHGRGTRQVGRIHRRNTHQCLYVRYVNVCERIKYANYIRMLYVYTHTSLFPHILQAPKTFSHLLPLLCRILPPCCCFNRFASVAFVWRDHIRAHAKSGTASEHFTHTHTPARRPG